MSDGQTSTDAAPAQDARALSAGDLMTAAACPAELVRLEGIGSVWVRGMTAGEAGKIGQMHTRGQGDRLAAQMAAWCLQNADGSRMFRDDQVGELMGWRADLLQPIADAVLRLSGLEGGADVGVATAQGN